MMQQAISVVNTFPSVKINSVAGLTIEVSLIAQLGHGAGDGIYQNVLERQKHHPTFVDALNEPSVKLAGVNVNQNDFTSLYSFIVGAEGHPFHRHAGHRILTAISGSGGAQLRFCTATDDEVNENANSFLDKLHFVHIPPDSLFTVRFAGETWHQFIPITQNGLHPTFIALSCHTNELGGINDEALKQQVIADLASIPSLTELLPNHVQILIDSIDYKQRKITTTVLSIDAPEGTLHKLMCATVRCITGLFRGNFARLRKPVGYATKTED